ncbi:MAG: SDR family oxidoreductase [Carbonactinosporaceae bacterium]
MTVALVTGGAGGFGTVVARRLSAAGTTVVLADIDERGPEIADQVGGSFVRTDVTRRADLEAAVAAAEERGPLTQVFLNAGVASPEAGLERVTEESYRHVIGVNVDGVFWGLRAALPALRRAGGGAVVVTASLAGLTPWPDDPVYTLTKHAAVALSRAVAPELAAEGIRVCVVCPGFADTPLVSGQLRESGFPLLTGDEVGEALVDAAVRGEAGHVYLLQPGREVVDYRHHGVPSALSPDGQAPEVPRLG